MATKFLNTALGFDKGGIVAWGVAGGAAYYFFYLPQKRREEEELARAANAVRLMKEPQYADFKAKHEAAQREEMEKRSKTGWFGGLFRGGGKGEA